MNYRGWGTFGCRICNEELGKLWTTMRVNVPFGGFNNGFEDLNMVRS